MSSQNYSEPACHSYLGDQLKDSRRRGLFDVEWGKEYRLLLIPLVDIVLFPGETIPLRLQDQNLVNHVKRIINDQENSSLSGEGREDLLIGVVNNPRSGRGRTSLSGCFGTTIEIRSSSCSQINQFLHSIDPGRTVEEIVLTGRGQFRFQIVHLHHVGGGVNYATAKMFNERTINRNSGRLALNPFPSWVYTSCAPSTLAKKAFLMVETALFWKAETSALLGRWGLLSNLPHTQHAQSLQDTTRTTPTGGISPSKDSTSSHKAKRTRTTSESGAMQELVIGKESAGGCGAVSSSSSVRIDHFHSALYGAELDPVGFSFFLSANLPVSNEQLQTLLAAGDVTERLRLCIQYLEMGTGKVLACGVCRLALASKQQVFTVPGAEGVTGAYVNPHGAVHQTITVRDVLDSRAVVLHGRPCAEDSWFPGYAWTIASCARCLNHLGWRFTQVTPRGGGGGSARVGRVYPLPASLASIAGTAAEALWQSFMQQQEEQREQEERDEEEEDSGYSMLDSEHSSDFYSDEGADSEDEEDGEGEEEQGEGAEEQEDGEGEEVEDVNDDFHSGSERSSTYSDMRDTPIVQTLRQVHNTEVVNSNLQVIRMDSDDERNRVNEEEGEEESEEEEEEEESEGSDDRSLSETSVDAQHTGGEGRQGTALPAAAPRRRSAREEGAPVERVSMFWGLRRSGLVEA